MIASACRGEAGSKHHGAGHWSFCNLILLGPDQRSEIQIEVNRIEAQSKACADAPEKLGNMFTTLSDTTPGG